MQTIELNKMGLQEMSTNEQQVIEGGGFWDIGFWDVFNVVVGAAFVLGAIILDNTIKARNNGGSGTVIQPN